MPATSQFKIATRYKPIFSNAYNTYLFYGGRGGSKSYSVTDCLIILAKISPIKIVVCRETQTSLGNSIRALFSQRISDHGLANEFTLNNDVIRHANGSEILFVGINSSSEASLESFKSIPAIDIILIEEASSIKQKSLDVVIPTLRRNPKGSKLICLFNPKTEKDPVWRLVEEADSKTYVNRVTYLDNPWCPQETIDEAKKCEKFRPMDYTHIWMGYPRNRSARSVVRNFTEENVRTLRYQKNLPLHLSTDFNLTPMCWVVCHKVDDVLLYIDEITMTNATTKDATLEFIKRYGNHESTLTVYGDASGQSRSVLSETTNYQQIKSIVQAKTKIPITFKLRSANPKIMSRVDAFNNRVQNLDGVVKLYVSTECPKLLDALKYLAFEDASDKIVHCKFNEESDSLEGYREHIFDACSYIAEYLFPSFKDM